MSPLRLTAVPLLLALGGCHPDAGTTADAPLVYTPASATLHRLTQTQYRYSVVDLLGVTYDGTLPADYALYNYATVGGSEASLAPVELEEVETAAWAIAQAAAPDATHRDQLLGCTVGVPLGAPAGSASTTHDDACLRGWVVSFGRHAWRRALAADEVDELVTLADTVGASDPTLGVQALIATFLLSPDFLYRVELGTDDPAHPGTRPLTGYELAARLSYFLTNSPPDEALLLAAERGDLATDEGLRAQAERLFATDRAREAMVLFWDETMSLATLDLVAKDQALFPEFTDSAKSAMRSEVREMFGTIAVDEDGSVADLYTTDLSFVNHDLGAIYGLDIGGDDPSPITMPAAAERGGVLGRAAFLTMMSNATFNSPTRRGKFVRTHLLCQDIPPPPAGVPTLESEANQGTLRDQLVAHVSDPSCAGCHTLMDPIGFGFEHFDPIGQRQETDHGLPIDTTGDLDGTSFNGAVELGRALAEHPAMPGCFTRELYRHAKGELESEGEEALIESLGDAFTDDGLSFHTLVMDIVLSDGFRTVGAPATDVCTDAEEGQSRACATDCGAGTETCVDGDWVGCDAPAPSPEVCDGVDNDCDGPADEDVVRPCDATYGPGTQSCVSATWQACVGPTAPAEVCNGLDDDANGLVDDGLEVSFEEVTYPELTAAHESCDPVTDPDSGACHAAVHRICGASGCGTSGFGIVADNDAGDSAGLGCVGGSASAVVVTTYSELSTYHAGCTSATPRGPDCYAAINRWCAARGQTTGFGPDEYSGDSATVTCTPGATVVATGYSTLVAFNSVCDGATERVGQECNVAFHLYCQSLGYETGYGPLENSGDVAYAACLRGT